MNKLPTAEQFVNQYDWENSTLNIPDVLVEFAKLHVEAALEAANNKVNYAMEEFGAVFPNTVLNVYPLDNIK